MISGLLLAVLQTQTVYDGFDQSSYMDKKLAEWRPASTYLAPDGVPQMDHKSLIGEWGVSSGFEGTTVTFFAPKDGILDVTFSTGGCLGMWLLKRTAVLQEGVVRLNKPVQSYCGQPYDRYFFVKRGGGLWLVPAGSVERAIEHTSGDHAFGTLESWFEFFSLQKREYRKG